MMKRNSRQWAKFVLTLPASIVLIVIVLTLIAITEAAALVVSGNEGVKRFEDFILERMSKYIVDPLVDWRDA